VTLTEFELAAVPYFEACHAAMLNDNGSIDCIYRVGAALDAALQFMSDTFDQTEDPEIRDMAQVTGGSLAEALFRNTARLLCAQQAEAEIEMFNSTMATIH